MFINFIEENCVRNTHSSPLVDHMCWVYTLISLVYWKAFLRCFHSFFLLSWYFETNTHTHTTDKRDLLVCIVKIRQIKNSTDFQQKTKQKGEENNKFIVLATESRRYSFSQFFFYLCDYFVTALITFKVFDSIFCVGPLVCERKKNINFRWRTEFFIYKQIRENIIQWELVFKFLVTQTTATAD